MASTLVRYVDTPRRFARLAGAHDDRSDAVVELLPDVLADVETRGLGLHDHVDDREREIGELGGCVQVGDGVRLTRALLNLDRNAVDLDVLERET